MNLLLIIIIALFISACGTFSSYSANMDKPIKHLTNGNSSLAQSAIVANKNDRDKLLYFLEYGTLLRINQNYNLSNQNFNYAQAYIDAWVASFHNATSGRISDTLQAGLLGQKSVDYIAKDYEKVMLPTYKALNDLNNNDFMAARVEIMRMYNLENLIADFHHWQYAKLEQEQDANAGKLRNFSTLADVEKNNQNKYDFAQLNNKDVLALKNSYQNAFSHYLAGFIFQALGEDSLARPGYVKALQLKPNNQLIKNSIAQIDNNNKDGQRTDLLVIEEVGHAPQLKSVSIPIMFMSPMSSRSCINAVNIAFPELVLDTGSSKAAISIDNQAVTIYEFADFDLMAKRYLHDNIPNIFYYNLIQALRDITLQEVACSAGTIVGLLTTLGTVIISSADERTWSLLPKQILLTRLKLNYGRHVVTITTKARSLSIVVNLTKPYEVLSLRIINDYIYGVK